MSLPVLFSPVVIQIITFFADTLLNNFLLCSDRKLESKKKQLVRLEEQLQKLEVQATDKVSDQYYTLITVIVLPCLSSY